MAKYGKGGYEANYQQYAVQKPSYGNESRATPNYHAAETTETTTTTVNSPQPIQTADVTLIIVVAVIGTLVLILFLCGGIVFWLALRLKMSQKSNSRQSNTDSRAIVPAQSEEYDDVAPAPPAEINIYEEIGTTLHYDYVTNPPQPPELCTRPVFSSLTGMPPNAEIFSAEYDDVGPVEKEQHCEYVQPARPSKVETNKKHSEEEQYLKVLP